MKRREFIGFGVSTAALWPLLARAQAKLPLIGFLNSSSPDLDGERMRAFRLGLAEAGYVDGRNVTIEYRWADGRNDLLPAMAADMVARGVSILVTGGTPATLAAKAATAAIPTVFILSSDPVKSRAGRQPEPAGRQHHRSNGAQRPGSSEEARACPGAATQRKGDRVPSQSDKRGRRRRPNTRRAGGRPSVWLGARGSTREQRS